MLKSVKNSFLATSIVYIVIGLILFLFPGMSISIVCAVIGVACLVYGIGRILSYVKKEAGTYSLILGIIVSLLGAVLFFSPAGLLSILPIILGIYIIVDGVSEIKRSLELRDMQYGKWGIALAIAILITILGIIIIINPFAATKTVIRFFGIVMLVEGISNLFNMI